MRVEQIPSVWVFCKLVSAVVLTLGGCSLYVGDDAPPDTTDAGSMPDAVVDAATPPPDAEVLEACEEVCEGEEVTEWSAGGDCLYAICRPSYKHCLCQEDYPSCEVMGCDGTQNVPLYCPEDGQACFCAAPDGPDGWCIPSPPLLGVNLSVSTDGTVSVRASVTCAVNVEDGPYRGGIELYVNNQLDARSGWWRCSEGSFTETWVNIPCGSEVWARAIALHPATGAPMYALSPTLTTTTCP